jgi:hypothetical protein
MFIYFVLLHDEEANRNTIGVVGGASAKLPHCTGLVLTYPMEKKMPFIHHVVERWGCGYTNEDDKSLSERTQRHLMLKPSPSLCIWSGNTIKYCIRMITTVWIR